MSAPFSPITTDGAMVLAPRPGANDLEVEFLVHANFLVGARTSAAR